MLGLVISQIISICRNFLCIGNTLKSKTNIVAWSTVCLPKLEGGLGLFDIKARNSCFIAKQLCNIYLKTDSMLIQWAHHFYLHNTSIQDARLQQSSSPLCKAIISTKDQLIEDSEGHSQVISMMSTWHNCKEPFITNAFEFSRPKALKSNGKRWYVSTSLCLDIILFYDWLCKGNS